MVADPKALNYIFHSSGYNFPKTEELLKVMELVVGNALVCSHGTEIPRISPSCSQ